MMEILMEIVDILEYMNNGYDEELIRKKIKRLVYHINNCIEEGNND